MYQVVVCDLGIQDHYLTTFLKLCWEGVEIIVVVHAVWRWCMDVLPDEMLLGAGVHGRGGVKSSH